MMQAQLNIFDSIVLAVLVLSSLLAFFRGFIREVLSLGSWLGAAIVTAYSFPVAAEKLKPHFTSETVATAFATLGTFLLVFVVLSIFSAIIIRYVKPGNEVGLLDNMLGLLFGLARGVFLIALGFYIMTLVVDKKDYPPWIAAARTRPLVETGAEMLASAAPDYMREMREWKKKGEEAAAEAPEGEPGTDTPAIPASAFPSANDDSTYKVLHIPGKP